MKAVYTLSDDAGSDHYVGISVNPLARLRQHLRDADEPTCCTKKADFLRTVIDAGDNVVMTIIDVLPDHEAIRLENKLIRQIGSLNTKRSSYRLSYRRKA